MGSFKRLDGSDAFVSEYVAHKQWEDSFYTLPSTSSYFNTYSGSKMEGVFDPVNDIKYNGEYNRLVYDMINHMFYQRYDGQTIDTGSLMFNLNTYISASGLRPTASYDFDTDPGFYRNFPTESGAQIKVIEFKRDIFGNKLKPGTFQLSSDSFRIKDDGRGNIMDISSGIINVGNIFYSHGIVVITNPEYVDLNIYNPVYIEACLAKGGTPGVNQRVRFKTIDDSPVPTDVIINYKIPKTTVLSGDDFVYRQSTITSGSSSVTIPVTLSRQLISISIVELVSFTPTVTGSYKYVTTENFFIGDC